MAEKKSKKTEEKKSVKKVVKKTDEKVENEVIEEQVEEKVEEQIEEKTEEKTADNLSDFLTDKKSEWYVIQVISGTEENVKESLMQRRESFGLEEYIIDVFIPVHDVLSVRKGGVKVRRKKNIFPGYILVEMVVTNESWYIVRNTPNVTGFLGAGNIPVPVSGEELDKLKGILEKNAETFTTKYKVGDDALISDGPFEGNGGIITEINEKKGLLKITINLLGRDTPLELDFSQIKLK